MISTLAADSNSLNKVLQAASTKVPSAESLQQIICTEGLLKARAERKIVSSSKSTTIFGYNAFQGQVVAEGGVSNGGHRNL